MTLDLAPGPRWVAEYYPVEDVEERRGGWLRVRLRTANPDWVPRLVLRLGGGARVVSPDHIAARLESSARAALAQYDDEV